MSAPSARRATVGLLLLSCCSEVSGVRLSALQAHVHCPRTTPPQLFFNRQPPPPPPPPPPPVRVPATEVVRRDLGFYVALVATVGTVPAIDWGAIGGTDLVNGARLAYFIAVAIGSVYLGAKRQDLGEASPITGQSAALAPLFASATLGGLYLLIKYTDLNPGTLYQFFACLFALLATSDLLQPLLGLAVTGELGTPADEPFDDEREAEIMNAGTIPAFAASLALVAAYAQGPISTGGALALPAFALNNALGWGITLASLGVLALEASWPAGLLLGLFCYDAFFVFKSDVMLTVATQIEAPASFLFAAAREAGDPRYPFSVLGLGDVVVPGAFVSLLREVDKDMDKDGLAADAAGAPTTGPAQQLPYFYAGLGAYAAGLVTTFVANYVTKAGQPRSSTSCRRSCSPPSPTPPRARAAAAPAVPEHARGRRKEAREAWKAERGDARGGGQQAELIRECERVCGATMRAQWGRGGREGHGDG